MKRVLFSSFMLGLLLLALGITAAGSAAAPGASGLDSAQKLALPYGAFGPTLTVDNSANAQKYPAVAWNGAASCDRFLVAYQSRKNGVDNDIWARYVTGSGGANGPGPWQMTADAAEQQSPSVAYNQAGIPTPNYLVVWMDQRNGNWDIYARFWDCGKLPATDEIQITTDAANQMYPDVVCGYEERICWIVWQDYRSGNWDIYGQVVDNAGALVGGNLALTTDKAGQSVPAIAYNPHDTGCVLHTFLTVWQDGRNQAINGYDIFGQQLSDSEPCGNNIPVYAGLANQYEPDVAYGMAKDRYLVVWHDYRRGATADIYARKTLPSGSGDGASFAVSTAPSTQARAAVAYDATHDLFLSLWQDLRNGTYDIFGQGINADGTLLGGNFGLYVAAGSQANVAVAFGATQGHFFAPWDNGSDIFGRALWP